jgi:hypothetical protein
MANFLIIYKRYVIFRSGFKKKVINLTQARTKLYVILSTYITSLSLTNLISIHQYWFPHLTTLKIIIIAHKLSKEKENSSIILSRLVICGD